MKRIIKITACFLIVITLFSTLYRGYVLNNWPLEPFKITDPTDPRFDPHQFKFEDYLQSGITTLKPSLQMILEKHSSIEAIEKILVESGGARGGLAGRKLEEVQASPDGIVRLGYAYQPWYDSWRFSLYPNIYAISIQVSPKTHRMYGDIYISIPDMPYKY